jgi:hypothetical protein
MRSQGQKTMTAIKGERYMVIAIKYHPKTAACGFEIIKAIPNAY